MFLTLSQALRCKIVKTRTRMEAYTIIKKLGEGGFGELFCKNLPGKLIRLHMQRIE